MELTVIRHTRVAGQEGICYGQKDVPLAASFADEAEAYRRALGESYDRVVSSPSERCMRLAQALDRGPVVEEEAWREMNFGDWEGQRWDDLDREALDAWGKDFVHTPAPRGESLQILARRVAARIETLRAEPWNSVLIVTHAGPIRCVYAHLLGIPLANIFKLSVGYGEILPFHLGRNAAEDVWQRKQ